MREFRNAQGSIFDFYSQHEKGYKLKKLSNLLDEFPGILKLIERDFNKPE